MPYSAGTRPEQTAGQLVRYSIIGGCGYLLAMALYGLQIAAGVEPYTAVPAAFVANGMFNFFANRAWSFPGSGRPLRHEFTRFWIVGLVSLVVNYACLYVLYDVAGMPPVPAQALAIVAATPVGFLGNKLWSFRAV